MKMRYFKIIGFFTALLLFSSCGKDFLDVKPTDSADAGTAIETVKDARVIMNGIMRRMASSDYYGRNFLMYGDVKGGDLTLFSQGRGLDALYTFNHSQQSNSYSGFWDSMYGTILQINNLLLNIDRLQAAGSPENFDNIKGQALTLRALIYFDLVRLYGKPYSFDKSSYGVPLITEPLPASARPLRASVEQNYTQILKDLTDAAPLMLKTKQNGFINYYGNKMIEARVRLNMEDHAGALAAAEEVINSGVYSLYSNANWAASWGTQFGSESIFELGVFPNETDLGSGSPGFYLRRRGHGAATALGWFMASDYFLNRLGEDEDDVRWEVMAADESSATRLGSIYKYSGGVDLKGDGKSTVSAVNIKVIRLSEAYLIAAEAALPTDPELAADYLNEIRKRSPNLAPATEATITLDMILDERSKELVAEGHRFFDMMRLNKSIEFNDDFPDLEIPHRPKVIDRTFYKAILPISQAEINANPGIQAQQNPQY